MARTKTSETGSIDILSRIWARRQNGKELGSEEPKLWLRTRPASAGLKRDLALAAELRTCEILAELFRDKSFDCHPALLSEVRALRLAQGSRKPVQSLTT